MKSWRINELGLPWEKCQVEETVLPDIPEGGCRVKVEATDLNFADILQCQGKYQVRIEPPFTPGMSAAGLVTQASKGSKFGPGDGLSVRPSRVQAAMLKKHWFWQTAQLGFLKASWSGMRWLCMSPMALHGLACICVAYYNLARLF